MLDRVVLSVITRKLCEHQFKRYTYGESGNEVKRFMFNTITHFDYIVCYAVVCCFAIVMQLSLTIYVQYGNSGE